ncbi:MAG: aminopeptidase N [Candidatus Protistobacter heckmanni]|nr:aminopeptidase N [Candidatus Protistobacter heckmanni]
MLRTDTPITVHRKDYHPPAFRIERVTLDFDLDPEETVVTSRMFLVRQEKDAPLVLAGEELQLDSVEIDGVAVSDFRVTESSLTLPHVPDHFELAIVTRCKPAANTSLMGLYVSSGNFFTQCEAEGFRKMTYFLDRPDNMARFTVILRAERSAYPVLLSNGNLIEQGAMDDGRHYAVWEDPFPKPSYLFALVAGKLERIERRIQSASGKDKLLQVWVTPRDLDKTEHAMNSLVESIRWDERRFGLELDLERFMIVAVGDFNMGAMENKGLNIFNTKFVLANPDTATDVDYANVESVVAHEYFHNWTGNRVTCRDWFQLSLKEGLTVFRDQEFSADMMGSESGRAVKRIEDVRLLRQAQFPEDAGPMSHPVRPDSYQEINNFYTVTVYEKGAEVVRMYQTLLGRDGFRKGMDLYFRRHDGQAVTCDDFLAAMADANQDKLGGDKLAQFGLWYSQNGTPRVAASAVYAAAAQTYALTLKQSGRPGQKPFHIPFALGLLDARGVDMPLTLQGESGPGKTSRVLELKEAEQTFVFTGVKKQPVPSLLRDFSAPVILDYAYSEAELLHLLSHDSDPFNRWEAGQRLATARILKLVDAVRKGAPLSLDQGFIDAWKDVLADDTLDPSFRQLAITLPAEGYLAEQVDEVDPQAIHAAREYVRTALSKAAAAELGKVYEALAISGPYSPDAVSAGKRGLRNLCLSLLADCGEARWHDAAWKQFQSADNMTDRFGALSALVNGAAPQAAEALDAFYQRHQGDALVIDKWFSLQATRRPGADRRPMIETVRALMHHKDFTLTNPNRARSVIHSFCAANPAGFHSADGAGHAFWAEQVLALNKINPQVSARLARALDRWRKFAPPYRDSMRGALETVMEKPDALSSDVREVVSKALENPSG